jgi:uncharacterized protein (TIGR03083 family)
VLLSPRYEGPPIISISGTPDDQLVLASRQRLRLESLLAELSEEDWNASTRCDRWTVSDVVAHIVGVNTFWHASLTAGLAGKPTQFLSAFDPAETPDLMVAQMRGLTPSELLNRLVRTNDSLLEAVTDVDDEGWDMLAEAPPGYLPVRLVVQHALWDCWIHERDIAIPLGVTTPTESDEVRSCLVYAAALSPALAIGCGQHVSGEFALRVTDPISSYVLEIDKTVAVRAAERSTAPCLEGEAVTLVEALSLRTPFPKEAPSEWQQLLGGLVAAFNGDMPGR